MSSGASSTCPHWTEFERRAAGRAGTSGSGAENHDSQHGRAARVYERLGGFDDRLPCSEDWEMWVRIAAHIPSASSPSRLRLSNASELKYGTEYT